MARIPLQIGALTFPAKSAAYEHFRQMLYRHEIGSTIPDPDASQLIWLLERHPEFNDKHGSGIERFGIRNALYGTRCFEVIRTDGSCTDFSFNSCIEGKRPTHLNEAIAALRAEVTEDILQKKRDWFRRHGNADGKVPCAISGGLITIEEAHADHAPPRTFGTLAIAFLAARGIAPDASFVTPPADNQYMPRIVDKSVAQDWRVYHHSLAVIRIVAKKSNLTRAHEGKVKRKDRQLRMDE